VEQTTGRLLGFALDLVGCRHGSVLLVQRGARLELSVASDHLAEKVIHLQAEVGQGPGVTAVRDEVTVVCGDTAADGRWPLWSPQVSALGLRSVLTIRLRTPSTTVGVLTLFDPAPDRFDDDEMAQVLADHAAVAVANARSESTLWQAIDARKLIGQAQGILMERFDLTEEQAFSVLRRYSQDNNVKLRDVAQRLVDTRKLS
jgi:GAF domain-containing protein